MGATDASPKAGAASPEGPRDCAPGLSEVVQPQTERWKYFVSKYPQALCLAGVEL